ncbi:MAG: SDR family NAD(P)-dependent oxidoreductase [Bacteroidota bacterium]
MTLSKKFKETFKDNYGPWALVTGASSGIGRELCKRLAETGVPIVLSGRNKESLRQLAEELEEQYSIPCEIAVADMSDPDAIDGLIAAVSELPLGLFIASAGFGTSGFFKDAELENEINMVKVNVQALLTLTHHFARRFSEQKRGGMVLLSSIVGFQGVPHAANYAATKAYVQSLGEGLYHELRPHGVDVLTAAPGPVNSGFAQVANMQMDSTLAPSEVAVPILEALGEKSTVFPGRLTKILMFGLRTVPRWGKIRIMKMVMGGMTEHQTL